MSDLIKQFTHGFSNGFKETPRMFFAPVYVMLMVVYHLAMGTDRIALSKVNTNSQKKKITRKKAG